MPIMNVRYRAGSLDRTAKEAMARRLTDVLIAMEGGANTSAGRAFAWVLFTEIPAGDWWVGGHADNTFISPPGAFLVNVTVPEGYMNVAHKSEVHAAVTGAITQAASASAQADVAASVLVVIDEVTEGNWGAGGRTISLDSIADSVGLPKSGERFRWVRSYFEAKARQFASAGYPTDAGGLLPSTRSRRQPPIAELPRL
jgi:phenylpyruvate tautomerase PptA (4-oxalocrotonate tautomerase family)